MIKDKKGLLKKIFFSTLALSAFTFGGGYVIITLMKKEFVDKLGWIEQEDMLDLVALAQSAPGPIAVNGAIVIGYKLSGISGILTAVIATIIPPFLIITGVSFFYEAFKENLFISLMLQGMQAGIAAVIASVVYEMATGIIEEKNTENIIIMILSFIATSFLNVNVIYLILFCILLGLCKVMLKKGGAD